MLQTINVRYFSNEIDKLAIEQIWNSNEILSSINLNSWSATWWNPSDSDQTALRQSLDICQVVRQQIDFFIHGAAYETKSIFSFVLLLPCHTWNGIWSFDCNICCTSTMLWNHSWKYILYQLWGLWSDGNVGPCNRQKFGRRPQSLFIDPTRNCSCALGTLHYSAYRAVGRYENLGVGLAVMWLA